MTSSRASTGWSPNKALYGIDVINLSIGRADCTLSRGQDAASQAVNAAFAAGLVVVVAAGNSGPSHCTVGTPAGAADALTVGAMADLGVTAGEGFGAVGPASASRRPRAAAPPTTDESSPMSPRQGSQSPLLAGSGDGYWVLSGTSMATPFLAGVAALMLDVNAGLTSTQVKQKIKSTTVDWARGGDNTTPNISGADADYGGGRLDAFDGDQIAGAAVDSPPVEPPHPLLEGSP